MRILSSAYNMDCIFLRNNNYEMHNMLSLTTGKGITAVIGGGLGWFLAVFQPTFPLVAVSLAFILWDVYSAYQLGRRVDKMYPGHSKTSAGKLASSKFGKVVSTISQSMLAILLCYAVEKWISDDIPFSKIAAGVICAWQGLSILENNMSCTAESDSRLAKLLHRILIDKTERHLNVSLDELRTDEEIKQKEENNK